MNDQPQLKSYTCGKCNGTIPPLTVHIRMTIWMVNAPSDTRRYCSRCCQGPELAVLMADVYNNPVKHISIFVVYR